jgi:gamma-glutamyltranspeptidase/glutathione hydrolase
MTLADLAKYKPEWTDAICSAYRQYRVCVPPPPSSGVSLLQVLAILDQTDIATRGPQDSRAWFLLGEASRLMYADRDQYIADPHFVAVPVEGLLDPRYVRQRAQLIGERPQSTVAPGLVANLRRPVDATLEVAGTSHFVIADAKGNVVSMTTTVESVFGSGRIVGGFALNNQLTDFSLQPIVDGKPAANAIASGKRPRSSMAPVIVLDRDGRFVAALGSPGGSAILAYNAKALVGVFAWKLSMQQAIELPNLIARSTQYQGEGDRFPPGVLDGLRALGADVQAGRAENSGLHGIVRKPDGSYEGGADPRREGIVGQVPAAELKLSVNPTGSKSPTN